MKIPYCKIQIFLWQIFSVRGYDLFFANFLDILTTGSLEMGRVSSKAFGLNV